MKIKNGIYTKTNKYDILELNTSWITQKLIIQEKLFNGSDTFDKKLSNN